MNPTNRIIRVIPRPHDDILMWVSFLAVSPLDERDVTAIGSAIASEGPMATLTHLEAQRALADLAPLDDVGRAHSWIATRTAIHTMENFAGASKIMLGVLHRHDPVYVADDFGTPIITDRSVKDWWTVTNVVADLAGLPQASLAERNALRNLLRDGGRRLRPDVRNRIGHAPVIRAAIFELLAANDGDGTDDIARSLAWLHDTDDDFALHREVERLWLGAELHRLARTIGPSAAPIEGH